ncbi:SMC-Scp complex subunit ScpB [Micromonospora yangpuensis]|uniref:Segregation and condensation protein B n=1 Tax=Micromonospora yangpuensis TaxID=683228 RepID=A0A1C6UJD5_9ACTN|nr:SMC-Scp complex subunit ScpB [Micromonospora yangpuensis]GGM30747.1 hypothetical protein GCM10012279_57050 [Micromonospora yangpuensis]SCL54170.1 segregation and condensation protein B [Micromonospora yangpuensis]
MGNEDRRDSLADQAAAWVPPWAPERRPAPADAPAPAPLSEPGTEEPAPDAEEPAPGTEEPAPGTEEPAPGTEEPAPGAVVPAPDLASDAGGPAPDAATGPATGPATATATQTGSGAGAGLGAGGRRGRGRRVAVPEPTVVELDDAELRGALEAILLVVDEPVSELLLAQVVEQAPERVGRMLDEIAAGYTAAGHGFELRRAAGGWRLYTRGEYASYVERFVLDGQSVRLTQAALETLAVVAYKQPVTRGRISAIRGVNCDGVIRTLVSRGLVEDCGTEPDSGAFLYRTTTMFLEKLGLNSVHELPPLAPFLPDDVEELADATR